MEPRDPIHGLTADELAACDRLFDVLTQEMRDAVAVVEVERAATAEPTPFRAGRRPESALAEAPTADRSLS